MPAIVQRPDCSAEKSNSKLRHFGFLELRDGQAETIAAILRESILAVMPTGAISPSATNYPR